MCGACERVNERHEIPPSFPWPMHLPPFGRRTRQQPKAMDLVKAAIAGRGTVGATGSGANATSPSGGGSGREAEDAGYLEEHPEVRAALNDFVSALLLEKPEVGGL